MNYRELLKKYMKHVGYCEGTAFLPTSTIEGFTEEEILEFKNIEQEVDKEMRTK